MRWNILIALIGWMAVASLAAAQPPDTLWTRIFGGHLGDYGYSVQQTRDGGYIIAGRTFSYGACAEDVYLIKTDASGIEQWSQTFGGSGWDWGSSVQQTSDGGYIIAGFTDSYGSGGYDVYLIRTDALGIEQWSRTFGGSSNDHGYSVQQTGDGGYIIVGYTYSYGAGEPDVYLIKTDASGMEQWSRTFGGSSSDKGYSVQQTSDGGYIIAGDTFSFVPSGSDVYLIKTDDSGNQQWSQFLGNDYFDGGKSVQQTSDGGYIIAGQTHSYGVSDYDVYLIKTDAFGIEQWNQTFGGGYDDYGYSVQQTGDGGYVIAGETESYGAGEDDVYVIKTDAAGIAQWSQTLGRSSYDHGRSIQQTADGGYIIAGYTDSYGTSSSDVWLIRLEAELPLLILTPLNPPIQIPAGGGSFSFDIEIVNGTTTNYIIDASTDVTLPGGTTYPLLARDGINLASGTSLMRNLTQFVPGEAPAGSYAYNGYVHDHATGDLLAEDSFPFEKLAGDDHPNHNLEWALFGWDSEEAASVNPPAEYALYPASPNPANPVTWVTFHLPAPQKATLAVYNLLGQKVATLAQGLQPPGTNTYLWNAAGFASGVYIVRLEVEENQQVGKVVVLR